MNLIIMGPQASGKGTQASKICSEFSIPHISTGDIFREHIKNNSSLGQEVVAYTNEGKLVPDQLVIKIINDRLSQEDCKNGYLLDGFPRTIPQAEALLKITSVDKVVSIEVPDEVCIKRISGRYIHKDSGRTYNVNTFPKPQKMDVVDGNVVAAYDDVTGEPLIQRDDDKPEQVIKRLADYHNQTEPIKDFFKDMNAEMVVEVDGEKDIEGVFTDIMVKLK